MYQAHFNFSQLPFSLTPDTDFFVNQYTHQSALNTLVVALKHSEGFVKIVGEVGTGKTLISRMLLSKLDKNTITVFIPNPYLTPDELKSYLAKEIGLKFDKNLPNHEMMTAIYRRLLAFNRASKNVVVIVDETQTMPRDTLECLRLLTNLETQKNKLLQVVIIGQPELDEMLARKDLRQLRQRIVFSEYLKPFGSASTKKYVQLRLARASMSKPPRFSYLAQALLYSASGGIPRLINILCHKALLSAFGKARAYVNHFDMARAIHDTIDARRAGKIFSIATKVIPDLGGPKSTDQSQSTKPRINLTVADTPQHSYEVDRHRPSAASRLL